jgi:predicted transcriptional regulator
VCAREAGRPGHRISLRVSDELYQAIAELAERDRRPLTMWVRQRLEDAVAAARAVGTGGAGTRKR